MTADTKQVPAVAKRRPPAAGKGRRKGTPNKTTRALKEAIVLAAEKVGQDGKGQDGLTGYLVRLATDEPKAFAALLGKVLPLQVTGEGGGAVQIVISQADAEL